MIQNKIFHKWNIKKNAWLRLSQEFCCYRVLLTHFMPLVTFYAPWTNQKSRGFPMLSGGVGREQWYEISQSDFYIAILAMK